MSPPATPDDNDDKGGTADSRRTDDVFWCPVCGQKHRGDLTGIKAGGTMRATCAHCRKPLAVRWDKGVAKVTAGTSDAGRHGTKAPTEPGANKAPHTPSPRASQSVQTRPPATGPGAAAGKDPSTEASSLPPPSGPVPAGGSKPATGPGASAAPVTSAVAAPAVAGTPAPLPPNTASALHTPTPVPLPASADWSGSLVEGRYRVTALLGAGGMGTAYQARDERMNRTVVLKVPHPALLADEGFRKRFEHEIRSLTTLEHPHVVKAFDVGVHGGVPYAVLQYLGGGSLAERLQKAGGKMPPADILRWLPGVADALDFIHSQGMVHRDVKPANIIFDEVGHPFVADLGIAKASAGQHTGLTQTGQTPGSPEYMAPEVLAGVPVGPPYDQYSLGVVVYEALSGRAPLVAQNALALLLKKRTEPPTPLAETAPQVPPIAAAAVLKALETDPGKRHSSCVAFARAFAHGVRAPMDEQKRAAEAAARPPKKAAPAWRKPALIGGGVVLVAVAAAAAFLGGRGTPTESKPDLRIEGLRDGLVLPSRTIAVEGSVTRGRLQTVWVNGEATPVKDRTFSASVVAKADGDVTVSVADALGAPALWSAKVRVDTEPPRLEVTDPAEASASYSGAKALVTGTVVDANPDVLLVDGVPRPVEGSFQVPVDIPEKDERVLGLEARDKAGNSSGIVYRRLRRQGNGPAWAEPLAKAKEAAAAAVPNWAEAARWLDEAMQKGVPGVEIPATLSQAVDARKALKSAIAAADARNWPAARDALQRARLNGVTEGEIPPSLVSLLAAQDKIASADAASRAGDWVGAQALVDEAKALGAIDADLPKRLRDGLTAQDRIAKAVEAGKRLDWAAVKEFVDAAKAHGATAPDVPPWIRDGLAQYDKAPTIEIDEPAEGAVLAVPTFLVRCRATLPRDSDEVQVQGAAGGVVPDGRGFLALVTVSDALEGPGGPAKVVVRVMDKGQVRAEVERKVEYRPAAAFTKFLAGWAMPAGPEVDKATGYPVRIRRLKDLGVMAFVPAGRFRMGGLDKDEKPAHTVTISKAFYLDATEVSGAQFSRFVQRQKYATVAEKTGKGGWVKEWQKEDGMPVWEDAAGLKWDSPEPGAAAPSPSRLADLPVTQVAWEDASAFAQWAGAGLPTEAQFEYVLSDELADSLEVSTDERAFTPNLFDASAARRFAPGASPGTVDDGVATTGPVARGKAYLGLFQDLLGNVWEWAADWYAKDYYTRSVSKDPPGPTNGTQRVARGGSWSYPAAAKPETSVKNLPHRRLALDPTTRRADLGFRCAKSLP